MDKCKIKYYDDVDCICIPYKPQSEREGNWRYLQPPFIIIPLGWDCDQNYKNFEKELKILVSKYFDKEYISQFMNS